MIVLDASAALELLLNAPLAESVASRVFADGESLHAPHLIDLEVAQVLRRFVRRGEIDAPRALQAFADLDDLGVVRYPHRMLIERVWSMRDDATAYDAAYLALSLELGATLLTCDAALASVPARGLKVDVVAR